MDRAEKYNLLVKLIKTHPSRKEEIKRKMYSMCIVRRECKVLENGSISTWDEVIAPTGEKKIFNTHIRSPIGSIHPDLDKKEGIINNFYRGFTIPFINWRVKY